MNLTIIGYCIKLSNRPHIVFLTPGFPENELDTTCIPALQIFARHFAKEFPGKITLVSFQYPFERGNYLWNRIEVHALAGRNSSWKKKLIWHRARRLVCEIHQKHPVTHIHSFWMGECAKVGQELAERLMIPHSCTLMGQDALAGNPYFKRLKSSINLITLSEFHRETVFKNYQIESLVIPWGIEENTIKRITKDIDIIGVGNLITSKRFDEFIQIVQGVIILYPQLQVKIVGGGPLMDSLRKTINNLSLDRNVKLMGLLSYHETQQLIGRSRILLHMSEYESFGMVFIESLAEQTWVICRPVGIAREIGTVIKVNNVLQAKKAVQKILAEGQMPETIQFCIQDTVSKYIDLVN